MTGSSGSHTVRPSWALGLCDICGFVFPLNSLKQHIYDGKPDGLLVCDADNDVDNPQLQLGRYAVTDDQSLRDPRPDSGRLSSTSYFGWMPIGSPLVEITCSLGTIEVSIT